MKEEGDARIEENVTVEIFMGLVQHAAIVAGVDIVTPTILGWINVSFRHANQAHLLIVPVALAPAHPMASRKTSKPHNAGAQP